MSLLESGVSPQHFSELLIVLGIVGLTIPLLRKLRISSVVGFLLCGVMIGPHGFMQWMGGESKGFLPIVENSLSIRIFSELGVMFLMFMIGLKLSLHDLWKMRRHIAGLGSSQVLLTTFVIAAIAFSFGNDLELSVLIGACFSLSSTAVVMQLFEEQKRVHSMVGKTSFSVLLMQDLAVVPILTMITMMASGEGQSLVFVISKSILIAAAVILSIYLLGKRILSPALTYLHPEDQSEWLMPFVLFVAIGTALLTQYFGLSSALGAFLAGLLLAETTYKQNIERIITPLRSLLLGVFFLSTGMMIDPAMLLVNPLWIFLSVVGIGLMKAAILFGLCLCFRLETRVAAETSIMLGQAGEFVFVIIALSLGHKIISIENAQFFMIVTVFSMMLTPFVALFAPSVAERLDRFSSR